MLSLRNIKMPINHSKEDLEKKIIKLLKAPKKDMISFEIVKKAIDSRKKDNIFYVYNVNVSMVNEKKYFKIKNVFEAKEYKYENIKVINNEYKTRPIIIGLGPAGLLCAITLLESGLRPIIVEQGKDVEQRQKDIDEFFKTGKLNTKSNVQFGAGGAGTFSDGKLTTGVNDPRKAKLVEELILAGAPEEIRYLSKPHLGTDILSEIVKNLCDKIIKLGGEILYSTTFLDFNYKDNKVYEILLENPYGEQEVVECEYLILAIGHSSRETFYKLYEKKVQMKAKPFAMGVRVEHLAEDVNKCQYGVQSKNLDTASYKLNVRLDTRTLHTFCMCPGGVVVGAASETGRVVTNGMSYYDRNLVNSNSALLVNILPEDFDGEINPLNGIEFQRKLEEKAYLAGGSNYYAPCQKVGDFLNGKVSKNFDKVKPSYLPGITPVDLQEVFPKFMTDTLKEGIVKLQNKVEFLKDEEAVLTAVESRSSSPVTIIRDEKYMANIYGIIPCGEGAGYAGGIVSAAIDGIKCAEKVIEEINNINDNG